MHSLTAQLQVQDEFKIKSSFSGAFFNTNYNIFSFNCILSSGTYLTHIFYVC